MRVPRRRQLEARFKFSIRFSIAARPLPFVIADLILDLAYFRYARCAGSMSRAGARSH